MQWSDGVFRCSPLGIDDCVVWWDAVAAIGSIIGVVATVILGVFTYRLGVAANRASKMALRLSENADAVRARDRQREADVIMQFLRSEFAWTANNIQAFLRLLRPNEVTTWGFSEEQKAALMEMLPSLQMMETQSQLPRLHVLSDEHLKVLAKVLSQCRMFFRFLERFSDPEEFDRGMPAGLEGFIEEGPKIVDHLRWLVREANKLRLSEQNSD